MQILCVGQLGCSFRCLCHTQNKDWWGIVGVILKEGLAGQSQCHTQMRIGGALSVSCQKKDWRGMLSAILEGITVWYVLCIFAMQRRNFEQIGYKSVKHLPCSGECFGKKHAVPRHFYHIYLTSLLT